MQPAAAAGAGDVRRDPASGVQVVEFGDGTLLTDGSVKVTVPTTSRFSFTSGGDDAPRRAIHHCHLALISAIVALPTLSTLDPAP